MSQNVAFSKYDTMNRISKYVYFLKAVFTFVAHLAHCPTYLSMIVLWNLLQCYLPIHDLPIHYPRRFTVSYLFLKTSNSRINKKKPPNSRINKKKPTNSRLYYSELGGKSWILNSRISNSRKIPGPKKCELGGNTVPSGPLHVNVNKKNIFYK